MSLRGSGIKLDFLDIRRNPVRTPAVISATAQVPQIWQQYYTGAISFRFLILISLFFVTFIWQAILRKLAQRDERSDEFS
jgi:hypothetical protein